MPGIGPGAVIEQGQLKMTQADNAHALRMSLASAGEAGSGQACAPNTLPAGWRILRSRMHPYFPHVYPVWYATAPYQAHQVPGQHQYLRLFQTVTSDTWPGLCAAVAEEVDKYRRATGRPHVMGWLNCTNCGAQVEVVGGGWSCNCGASGVSPGAVDRPDAHLVTV